MASADDVNSTLQNIVQNLGQWIVAFKGRNVAGTFTLANATATVVTQPNVTGNSFISIAPTNAAAALTQRTDGLYISAQTAGVSFSVSTQAGSAAGTETFSYIIFNPS